MSARIAVLGAGAIAQSAHLPAYAKAGLEVAGVWARSAATVDGLRGSYRVYDSLEQVLADPDVDIVDIATPPAGRLDLLEAAVAAGKHALVQKPMMASPEELPRLLAIVESATARGLRIAVNQNARWAPVWREATLLLRSGAIGEVVGVTHLHDKPLPPLVGTPFDDVEQMLLVDYLNHWFDITSLWLAPAELESVSAHSSRVPGQPDAALNPWQASAHLRTSTGATASLRIVGNVTSAERGCPFWVHGTTGTLRGSILRGTDALEIEDATGVRQVPLAGEWFVDGFAGTMLELVAAIEQGRAPENDVASVVPGQLAAFAARASARTDGAPVAIALGDLR